MTNAGVVRCLFAALLFGATAPAASELAGTVPAFTLAGLLYLGAALAVAPSNIRHPPARSALESEWRPVAIAVVFGGAVGPVLLVAGLARTSAASASILLNTELVATVVLAALLFREHLGRRVVASAALVTAAGAVLTWDRGAGVDVGAALIVAACVCWGLDNCVTARIEHLAPEHVVALKGVVAGGTNLAIGLVTAGAGTGTGTGVAEVGAALLIGAAGYGLSIVLWVKGARELGAARAQVIFATAPFAGALIAWLVLREHVAGAQLAAVALAAAGVGVSLRSAHEHRHHHHAVDHDHEHVHDVAVTDAHHDHVHPDGFSGRHAHPHRHRELEHAHPHVPDLHHRHDH